jgi:hypothetical protein
MRAVHVVGGGPADVMAAFAAMREAAGVPLPRLFRLPHHHRLRPCRSARLPGARAIALSRHPALRAEVGSMIEAFIRGDNHP